MEKQTETKETVSSENIIIRVRGPWGVSRIRCHRLDSLADLKRSVSARINGLPRSSASILLFHDEHYSVKVAGEESATIRSIKLKNGEILYAKPKSIQTNSLPKEDVSKQESSATVENKVKKHESVSNLSKSRLVSAYNSGCDSNLSSLTLTSSIDPGTTGSLKVINGMVTAQASGKFSKTLQNLYRKQSYSPSFGDARLRDQSNFDQPDNRKKHSCMSWLEYLRQRGWSAQNKRSFSFDLNQKPRAHILKRGGAPNVIPDPISLTKQTYRHIDYVEFFNLEEVNNFVSFWHSHGMLLQRIGLLYGRYEQDETETQNGLVRQKVVIHGIYEPPQDIGSTGGATFLEDPYENHVRKVAEAAGLECVGWIFTYPPRSQTITAIEAYLMAKFQNAHLREDKLTGLKRSQFVSLTITKNLQGEVVPRAYMVSDQGMVLERSGMWSPSKDPYSCKITESISGKILPAVIRGSLQNTSHSHMLPGASSSQKALKYFDPDLVLVHIPCGQVKLKLEETAAIAAHKYRSRQIFYHAKFPIENRFQFGEIQNDNAARKFLKQNSNQTMEQRVADFHFLLCLPKLFTMDLALSVSKSVGQQSSLDDYCRIVLNAFMKRKGP